jgi:hypothetical protein
MKTPIKLLSGLLLVSLSLTTLSCGHKNITRAKDDQTTGYFYFELTPGGDGPSDSHPYYFSQVIAITYTTNNNLTDQENAYYAELMQKITDDGHDNRGYNQKPAPEEQKEKDSIDDKASVIKGLGSEPYRDVTIALISANAH